MAIEKEKLGCNTTTETLFVGVGGIGSEIIVKVAQRCKGTEAENIRFVAMDTNANDLRDVNHSGTQVTAIQTSSTQSVLDYLKKDVDARKNWFPNNSTLYPKTVSEGAGQVRAISRLALNATIKTGGIRKLYKAIDELFLKDGGQLKQALRVVIVASATGGTGSGIAMTVGMLIRQYLHNHYREKSAIIRGYLLLPGVMDTVIPTETERQSLRRNGYATLKEINAFMIKASGYCSVRKELERYKDLSIDVPQTTGGVERLGNLPFDFCFLLDRVDQSQESMASLEQYKEFAAQSLYEQSIGPMQGDAFGIEDNIIKDFGLEDNLGRNRFAGIGASILRYPYADVVEYVACARANECIGDGESVGEWLKYDEAYKKERAEFRKKRAYTTDPAPERSTVYMRKLEENGGRFDVDIKGCLASNVDKVRAEMMVRVNAYRQAFDSEIVRGFERDPKVKNMKTVAMGLCAPMNYEDDQKLRDKSADNLQSLRDYEQILKQGAATSAKATARAILFDAPTITGELKPFHLERMLCNGEGAMHPNAMRYVLYALKETFAAEYKKANASVDKLFSGLAVFGPDADNPDMYDVKANPPSKAKEKCFDEVCALEKVDDALLNITGGRKALWKKFNELFPAYANALKKYCDTVLREASYKVASEYIDQLCKEFEAFYETFAAKVHTLDRKSSEIVEKLRFKEGDSIHHVCATRDCLDRFVEICPGGSDGLMLPVELNAKIFESIKFNAESTRVYSYDPLLAKPKVDIFDTVLINHFIDEVSEDCNEILNMNIIQAIAREQEFDLFCQARKMAEEGEQLKQPEVSHSERMDYLLKKLARGKKLAAPGIGCADFSEPRLVELCAYNVKLNDLRDVDMKKMLETFGLNSTASDTVSRYDLRFFNALYNIRLDTLARFKSPEECEKDANYSEEAGIYYRAYHEYVKKIGPDSTRSSTISLHVDKRWDSLSVLPEISMDAHYTEMVRIHSALIYGIVHGMIVTRPSSRYDAQKRIFALEDMEGERMPLVVSNNSECNEFYEILDALYRDRASVAKIYDMQEDRCRYDIETNRRYVESAFVRDISTFRIGDGHDAPTSVFEIPLAYYNSLPRAKLDDNELSIMIDSVIAVLEKEVGRYEQEIDRDPFLASRLEVQFKLLIENYKNDAYNVGDAMRKNTSIEDNPVINMTLRKVCNKIKRLNTFRFEDRIVELRRLVK